MHRSQVSFVPVLFAALLDHHSNLEPAEIPANRRYIFQDAERWAVYLGLKFKSPPAHVRVRLPCPSRPFEARQK